MMNKSGVWFEFKLASKTRKFCLFLSSYCLFRVLSLLFFLNKLYAADFTAHQNQINELTTLTDNLHQIKLFCCVTLLEICYVL